MLHPPSDTPLSLALPLSQHFDVCRNSHFVHHLTTPALVHRHTLLQPPLPPYNDTQYEYGPVILFPIIFPLSHYDSIQSSVIINSEHILLTQQENHVRIDRSAGNNREGNFVSHLLLTKKAGRFMHLGTISLRSPSFLVGDYSCAC